MSEANFFVPENADRQCRCHPALLGFEAEVIDVEIGFFENLLEDMVGFGSPRTSLEGIEGDIDRHSAGDLARTQAANAVGDGRYRAVNEPVLLTFRLPK